MQMHFSQYQSWESGHQSAGPWMQKNDLNSIGLAKLALFWDLVNSSFKAHDIQAYATSKVIQWGLPKTRPSQPVTEGQIASSHNFI